MFLFDFMFGGIIISKDKSRLVKHGIKLEKRIGYFTRKFGKTNDPSVFIQLEQAKSEFDKFKKIKAFDGSGYGRSYEGHLTFNEFKESYLGKQYQYRPGTKSEDESVPVVAAHKEPAGAFGQLYQLATSLAQNVRNYLRI